MQYTEPPLLLLLLYLNRRIRIENLLKVFSRFHQRWDVNPILPSLIPALTFNIFESMNRIAEVFQLLLLLLLSAAPKLTTNQVRNFESIFEN